MGMAASQARLLSITSRMSDNELRAQLINNAKMRLTTDSSKISDEYIAALNQTQLMFSNFDTVGNEQYQDLTFNSLTAYSSYNNQYGIVNSAGELLVSGTDAANFEKAGNLENFLELYGLTKDTTYFEKNKLDTVGYYDDFGVWQDLGVTMGDMQDIYEGNVDSKGIEHYGYEESLNSAEYSAYESLVNDYRTAKTAYKTTITEQMNNFMDGNLAVSGSTLKAGGKNFETLYNEVNSLQLNADGTFDHGTIDKYRNYMKELMGQLGVNLDAGASASKFLKEDTGDVFVNGIKSNYELCDSSKIGQAVSEYSYSPKTYGYAKVDDKGNIVGVITNTSGLAYVTEQPDSVLSGTEAYIDGLGTRYIYNTPVIGSDTYNTIKIPDDEYSYKPLYYYEVDASKYDASKGFSRLEGTETKYYMYATTDSYEGNQNDLIPYEITDALGNSNPCIVEKTTILDDEGALDALKYMYDYFKNNALINIDEKVFLNSDPTANQQYKKYTEAAKNLAEFIYGKTNAAEISPIYYDYLDDPSWVLSENHAYQTLSYDYTYTQKDENGNETEVTKQFVSQDIDRTHYNPYTFPTTTTPVTVTEIGGVEYPVSYQAVKDAFLIECMLEHYGEPNYTWIDKNNPDENADAKAQWYTNLYQRMEEGYKEIPTNLMGSQEWMQFAFESGLVHMEQVDKSNKWVSTMYSNCSNITESTVDVDITVAEAKYNREMNKIEAKDKQYDLELKNIDTEHNSLQTEYDSIKSVIDKNVERNFKMFQA